MIITPTFSTFKIPFYMGPLQLSGGGGKGFEQSQPSLQTLSPPLSKKGGEGRFEGVEQERSVLFYYFILH